MTEQQFKTELSTYGYTENQVNEVWRIINHPSREKTYLFKKLELINKIYRLKFGVKKQSQLL